ncbi:MAG: ATP-binding protein [Sedimenticola sp.]
MPRANSNLQAEAARPGQLQEEIAFAVMGLDIIQGLLQMTNDLPLMVREMGERIREFSGARAVFLVSNSTVIEPQCQHRILGASPERHRKLAESEAFARMLECVGDVTGYRICRSDEPNAIGEALVEWKFEAALVLPLLKGSERMGWIVVLGVIEDVHLPAIIRIQQTLAGIASVVLQNALLIEDLRYAREEAESANRAKSAFLANMSHELRTPLNAILGFGELMSRDSSASQAQRENLAIIEHSGEHLLSLINDVLDMSKIEAGRTQLATEPMDLYRNLLDIVEMMGARCEAKGLSFQLDQDPALPRYVLADPSKLRQVIINLVGNAIKFTDEGGVSLRVRGGSEDKGLVLCFEVEDSGRGIAGEDLERIFEPFVQTGRSGADGEGTGLGLPITREYVELMGGEIRVSSHLGEGSLFAFDLSVEEAREEDVPSTGGMPHVLQLVPGQALRRVLVVDDNDANRLLLRKMLESVGFDVCEAMDGAGAVEQFQARHPDFIWMDMRMPVMDGYEATRRIKALPGGEAVKVVALSASAFSDERGRVMTVGCDDFVRKPFREAEIFEVMKRLLGVEYIYDSVAEAAVPQIAEDERVRQAEEAIARLPDELKARLLRELNLADVAAVDGVLQEVAVHNTALAEVLGEYAAQFRYQEMIELINMAEGVAE